MLYKHIKTGRVYRLWFDAINCTNAQDGQQMVVYYAAGVPDQLFVRDFDEFHLKFQRVGG